MPESSQYDVRELENLALPYDVQTKELDPKPRIVDGSNMYVTLGGKLSRRPAFTAYSGIPTLIAQLSPKRLDVYRSVGDEDLALVVSVHDTAIVSPVTYKSYYWIEGEASWSPLSTDTYSEAPHEIICINGKVYLKYRGLGTVSEFYNARQLHNISGGFFTESPWGFVEDIPAPTMPASAGWTLSTDPNTIRIGWKYAYGYESSTGHVSNRSPWVDTGIVNDRCPEIDITVAAPFTDTIEYPYVRVYRTTDGGGLFALLSRFANPGANFTFEDDNGAAVQPTLDVDLDLTDLAPDEVVNSGPPARNFPSVYNDPAAPHSNIAWFARRLWYSVGNWLYFSGQEEVRAGIPEECFPDPNGVNGNYYILPHDIVSVRATQDRLYVFTTKDIFVIMGEDRVNLRIFNLARNVGMRYGQIQATAAHKDVVFFLSGDSQVWAIQGDNSPVNISRDVAPTLRTYAEAVTDPRLLVYTQIGYTWLIVHFGNNNMMVYDIDRGFWYTPWAVNSPANLGAMAVGRLALSDPREYLIALVQATGGAAWSVATLSPDVNMDVSIPFVATFTTSLMDIPAGNHVNSLRQPGHHPMLSFLKLERTKFASDTEPTVEYRLDEFSGDWATGTAFSPPFLPAQRTSYHTYWYPIQQVVQRAQMRVRSGLVDQKFEVQTLGMVFTPEAGA